MSIFVRFLPCVTKLTALNLTNFFFVDIDLTSLMDNPQPANLYYINTSFQVLANAHFDVVSGLKEKDESVEDMNKKKTTVDSADRNLAKEKS